MKSNISAQGQRIRGVAAVVAAAGAVLLWPTSRISAVCLAAAAAFMGFEAAKGWCALRACGVKTRW